MSKINMTGIGDIEIPKDVIDATGRQNKNEPRYDTTDKPEYHIISKAEPMMNDEDIHLMVLDMKKNGFDKHQPVVMFERLVMDGRNRIVASKYAGVEVVTRVFDGTYAEAEAESIKLNNRRRHKSQGQKAMTGAYTLKVNKARREVIEEEIRASNPGVGRDKLAREIPQKCGIITSKIVAKQQGCSLRSVENAVALLKNDNELAERVFNGELSLTEANKRYQEILEARNRKSSKDGDFTPEEVQKFKEIEKVRMDPEGAVAKLFIKDDEINRLKDEINKCKESDEYKINVISVMRKYLNQSRELNSDMESIGALFKSQTKEEQARLKELANAENKRRGIL